MGKMFVNIVWAVCDWIETKWSSVWLPISRKIVRNIQQPSEFEIFFFSSMIMQKDKIMHKLIILFMFTVHDKMKFRLVRKIVIHIQQSSEFEMFFFSSMIIQRDKIMHKLIILWSSVWLYISWKIVIHIQQLSEF